MYQMKLSVLIMLGRKTVLFLLLLSLRKSFGVRIGIFLDNIIIFSLYLRSLPTFFIDHSLFFLILLFFELLLSWVYQSQNFLMFELVESQLFFFLLKDELLPLEFALELFSLPLQCSYLFISLSLYFCPLTFELFNLFLQLSNHMLINFFSLRLLFFEFGFNFPHFFLLDDVLLMKLSDLLLLLIDWFHLLLRFLSQLLELFLHSLNLVGSLTILICLQGYLLSFPDLLQWFFLLLQGLQLPFQMFQLVFLLNDLINIILAVQISPQFGNLCLVLLDPNLLVFKLFLQLDNTLVFLHLISCIFLLFTLSLLLSNLVHFSSQLFQLPFQFDVLLNQFCLTA